MVNIYLQDKTNSENELSLMKQVYLPEKYPQRVYLHFNVIQ